jgi:hypothetical protein
MRILLLVAVAGLLGFSWSASTHAQETPPPAPTDLIAAQVLDMPTSIELLWRDNAENERGYWIDRSTDGPDGPWQFLNEADGACTLKSERQCSYIDPVLSPETTYWYRVAAINDYDIGPSAYSNVASATTGGPITPEPGEIRGMVFRDKNGDGVRGAGEAGLQSRNVTLVGDSFGQTVYTDYSGEYVFSNVPPGSYTVTADLDERRGICSDGPFSFNPFPNSGCFGPTLPWNATTPSPMSVTKGSQPVPRIDFGAQPANVAVVVGLALLEDDFAPPGTTVEAIVNGRQCGTATVPGTGDHFIGDVQFELDIAGAAERPGCATRDDQVAFIVGGVSAAEEFSWAPFTEVSTLGGFQVLRLTAMQQTAWYWMEAENAGRFSDGAHVRAIVGGVVCGETVLQTNEHLGYFADPGIAGFTKLIVPSEVVRPGCGLPGATVSFTIDGAQVASMPWQPGLQEVGLEKPTLPPTGSAGRKPTNLAPGLLALVATLAALGAGAVALSLPKGTRPRRR